MNADELKKATALLAKLFACFPQSALADVGMQMRGYLDAVKNEELCDVEEAIGRFQRGEAEAESLQFCPSSAQLSFEVRKRKSMRELLARRDQKALKLVPSLPANHFQNRLKGGEK
jgi:hypothetical protein